MASQDDLELRARQIVTRLTWAPGLPLQTKMGRHRDIPYLSASIDFTQIRLQATGGWVHPPKDMFKQSRMVNFSALGLFRRLFSQRVVKESR